VLGCWFSGQRSTGGGQCHRQDSEIAQDSVILNGDAWLRVALTTLTEAEVGVMRIAAALMDRVADADLPDTVHQLR
jgi:hypothetical protein